MTNLGRKKWASASTVRVGSSLVTGMRIDKFYTILVLIHAEIVPKMYPSASENGQTLGKHSLSTSILEKLAAAALSSSSG